MAETLRWAQVLPLMVKTTTERTIIVDIIAIIFLDALHSSSHCIYTLPSFIISCSSLHHRFLLCYISTSTCGTRLIIAIAWHDDVSSLGRYHLDDKPLTKQCRAEIPFRILQSLTSNLASSTWPHWCEIYWCFQMRGCDWRHTTAPALVASLPFDILLLYRVLIH